MIENNYKSEINHRNTKNFGHKRQNGDSDIDEPFSAKKKLEGVLQNDLSNNIGFKALNSPKMSHATGEDNENFNSHPDSPVVAIGFENLLNGKVRQFSSHESLTATTHHQFKQFNGETERSTKSPSKTSQNDSTSTITTDTETESSLNEDENEKGKLDENDNALGFKKEAPRHFDKVLEFKLLLPEACSIAESIKTSNAAAFPFKNVVENTSSPNSKNYIYPYSSNKGKDSFPFVLVVSLVLALIFLVLALIFVRSSFFSSQQALSHSTNYVSDLSKSTFDKNFHSLKEKYPNQTNRFWANIESAFEHSIVDSKDPSIILVVNDRLTSHLAPRLVVDLFECFLNYFKKTATNPVINPTGDAKLSKLIANRQYDMTKMYVDNKLNDIFLNGNKFALVQNIEQMPATTMLLFYTYGDDLINAKYPGIIILMSLDLSDMLIDNSKRSQLLKSASKLSEYVENYLFDLWSSHIHDDQLRPLFTRIANNVVFINNEL